MSAVKIRLAAWWRRRGPWAIAVVGVGAGVALAVPVVDRDLYGALVATYLGAALGFLVALYVDRLQRSQDDDARRARDADADIRERARQAEITRVRRVAVLSLLREELGQIPGQMGQNYRQHRAYPPPDRMTDVLWRSLSSSGEIRWIDDLELLRKVAAAYDLLAVVIGLERRWLQAREAAPGGTWVGDHNLAGALARHDRDTWRAACEACKAMDTALEVDGAPPGANVGKLFCP